MLLLAQGLLASQIKLSFAEVAQSSDLIFIGTVESQVSRFNDQRTFIITEVLFTDIMLVHGTQRSTQSNEDHIVLQHAGGCVGDLCLKVSVAPSFQTGHRYLLFVSDDGKTYVNPMIGGTQGIFEVIKDEATGTEFVLTAGRRLVRGADIRGLNSGTSRVAAMRKGIPIYDTQRSEAIGRPLPAPIPNTLEDSASPALIQKELSGDEGKPGSFHLSDFINYIRDMGLNTQLMTRALKREDTGIPPSEWVNEMEGTVCEATGTWDVDDNEYLPDNTRTPSGGTLGYCGYHTLPFIMKAVPADWWSYDTFEASRQTWNWFMGIYQKLASDGKYGHNSKNEVCGWVSDADMFRIYGVHWNGYLGWAHSWWRAGSPCGRLLESDVLFNPTYDWTDNEAAAWGNADLILLRPVAMHEMAHTWGMQRGEAGQWGYYESYDYDRLTVVHSYNHNIIEDGRGIHAVDAFCLRRNYSSRTSILNTVDVGVESYYADNGLHNATADKSSYYPGDPISLNHITVENNSYNAVSEVRVRFYLSTDRTITTDDYRIGTFWNWESFAGESRSVFNIDSTIPDNVPAGTYYIGIMVTVNGDKQDDYTINNRTSFFSTISIKARSSGGNDDDGKPGGCFIATAAFGSLLHPHVSTLRSFRDTFLLHNEAGRNFVNAYYRYSPFWAGIISTRPSLKRLVQVGLQPLIGLSQILLTLETWF